MPLVPRSRQRSLAPATPGWPAHARGIRRRVLRITKGAGSSPLRGVLFALSSSREFAASPEPRNPHWHLRHAKSSAGTRTGGGCVPEGLLSTDRRVGAHKKTRIWRKDSFRPHARARGIGLSPLSLFVQLDSRGPSDRCYRICLDAIARTRSSCPEARVSSVAKSRNASAETLAFIDSRFGLSYRGCLRRRREEQRSALPSLERCVIL